MQETWNQQITLTDQITVTVLNSSYQNLKMRLNMRFNFGVKYKLECKVFKERNYV